MEPMELAMCGVRATAGEAQSILGRRRGAHGVGILEDADARGISVMRSRAWLSEKSLVRVIPCCLPSDRVLRRCDCLGELRCFGPHCGSACICAERRRAAQRS